MLVDMAKGEATFWVNDKEVMHKAKNIVGPVYPVAVSYMRTALLSSVTNVIAQNMPLLFLLVLPKKQEKLTQALGELGYAIAECQHDSTYYVVGFLHPEDRYRFGWPEHLIPTDEKLSVLQKMYIKGYLSQQKKYKSCRKNTDVR